MLSFWPTEVNVVPKLPHDLVAEQFMQHKGYGSVEPFQTIKLDNQPCWYFYYALPEGTLELEVSWNRSRQEWETLVTTFTLKAVGD